MPYSKATIEEERIGLELFFTDTPGIGGRMKKQPEDFIVTERSIDIEPLSEAELEKRDQTAPLYTYAKVTSNNWENNRLVVHLARRLGLSHDKIFFAGSKDKRAVTTQLMAFRAPLEDVMAIKLEGVSLTDFFISGRLLKVGDLYGNDFEMNIHELEVPGQEALQLMERTSQQLKDLNGFPNYFGVQRFGIIRPNTHEIGKMIVEKRFEDALWLFIGHPIEGEPAHDYEVRSEFEKCWDFEWAIRNYPHHLVFERILIKYLLYHPEDYTGAILQLPKNLGTMFVNGYQSFLYNKIISERVRAGLPLNEPVIGDIVLPVDENRLPKHKTWIPVTEQNQDKFTKLCKRGKAFVSGVLFGNESEYALGDAGEIERKIIEKEGITRKDFIVPECPMLSSKGTRRELVGPVFNFDYQLENDGNEEYIKVKFGLIKGTYATVLLREYVKGGIRSY